MYVPWVLFTRVPLNSILPFNPVRAAVPFSGQNTWGKNEWFVPKTGPPFQKGLPPKRDTEIIPRIWAGHRGGCTVVGIHTTTVTRVIAHPGDSKNI